MNGDDGVVPDPGLETGLLTHPGGRGGIGGGASLFIVAAGDLVITDIRQQSLSWKQAGSHELVPPRQVMFTQPVSQEILSYLSILHLLGTTRLLSCPVFPSPSSHDLTKLPDAGQPKAAEADSLHDSTHAVH